MEIEQIKETLLDHWRMAYRRRQDMEQRKFIAGKQGSTDQFRYYQTAVAAADEVMLEIEYIAASLEIELPVYWERI